MLYKDFYKMRGLRFIRDLLNPLVWESSNLKLPKKSMILWPNGSVVPRYPSTEYSYFSNLNEPRVYTILEYTESATAGNPRYRKPNINKIVKLSKLAEPSFIFIKTNKQITIPVNSEVLISMGMTNKSYRYTAHPLNQYYLWENNLRTTAEIANLKNSGINRHRFIYLELPYMIPNRDYINKHLGDPVRNMFSTFTDYTFFNMLELFKFVSKKYKDKSILATSLNEDEFKYVDLMLVINNKITVINLELLASITDAYALESNIKKYPSVTINKLMYIFLNKILEASPAESDDLDVDLPISQIAIQESKDITPNEISLDNVIETEISAPDEVVGEAFSADDSLAEDIDKTISNVVTNDIIEDSLETTNDIAMVESLTDNATIVATINSLADNKIMTKSVRDNLVGTLAEQSSKKSPYHDGSTIGDMLTSNDKDIVVSKKDTVISNNVSVLDTSMNRDPLRIINSTYLEKSIKKDTMAAMYSMQKAGIVIMDHEIETSKSILGVIEEHKLTLQSIDGGKSTVRIKLPVVNKDNTIRLSGNTYVMRKQRAD